MARKNFSKGTRIQASVIYPGERRLPDLKTTTLGVTPREAFTLAQALLESCEGTVADDELIEITSYRKSGKVTVTSDGRTVPGLDQT
jgi:hypothetical protein